MNLCGYIDDKAQEQEVLYALSKIELCEICEFEEYCKIFSKYFYKLEYDKAQNWLDHFFHKLPSPWDTKTRNGYLDYLKRIEKNDNLGHRIHYALKIIQDDYLNIKSYKKMKNTINNFPKRRRCCKKIIGKK